MAIPRWPAVMMDADTELPFDGLDWRRVERETLQTIVDEGLALCDQLHDADCRGPRACNCASGKTWLLAYQALRELVRRLDVTSQRANYLERERQAALTEIEDLQTRLDAATGGQS